MGRQTSSRKPSVATITREESEMADDTSKVKEDRKLVASEQTYEVADFSQKFGVSPGEAKTIIKRYGPSRKKLDAYMAARNA